MFSQQKAAHQPYVRIVEQPARSAVRFRYECEGRSAGPIPGVNSSQSCATYPTIQVMNYSGSRAMVVVSCVTVTAPYKQHPHHLVGRMGCHNGICTLIIENQEHLCTFTHLGIQCAKRNEIVNRLKLRQELGIDPTFGGFEHISKSTRAIDLGAVRLCFQVYLEGPEVDKFCIPLEPVISNPVYDKKLLSKLTITDLSTNSALVTGGKIMLFCNYIDEDDIEVLFFECSAATGQQIWQCLANLKPPYGEVHKRVGMSFMAPVYKDINVQEVVKCYMQLRRISDHEVSDPILFYYLPVKPAHNCPFVEHQARGQCINLNGFTKRVKSSVIRSDSIQGMCEQNENIDVSDESKPESVAKPEPEFLKFEDIDSDIEVSPEHSLAQNVLHTTTDGKPQIKGELIQNLFNEDTNERNLTWNYNNNNERPVITQNTQFIKQSDESDDENDNQYLQNIIQN